VLTIQEAGRANQEVPDQDVLAFASAENRAILTLNRRDFIILSNKIFSHEGGPKP
jgi:predicted nuclease of predicted toxin-antitoxin system